MLNIIIMFIAYHNNGMMLPIAPQPCWSTLILARGYGNQLLSHRPRTNALPQLDSR